MALGLAGPTFPEASVNMCLDQLKALVTTVPELAVVYGYRAAKAELAAIAAITSISDVPGDTPIGLSAAYDYIIDVLIRIDDDYEAAERQLNDAVDGIWRAIWGANYPYWSDCYAYAGSQKPASPEGLTNWRRGILYVRIIPQ